MNRQEKPLPTRTLSLNHASLIKYSNPPAFCENSSQERGLHSNVEIALASFGELNDSHASSLPNAHFGHDFSRIKVHANQRDVSQKAILAANPLARWPIQAKLAVSQPGDEHEREADRVAEQVMTGNPRINKESRLIQPLQFERFEMEENRINSLRGHGQQLSASDRAFFESRFGLDFSGVRVHFDAEANRLSHGLNAFAFTVEQDIFFREGEYNPGSQRGKWLIAHELTHVVQQSYGSNSSANSPKISLRLRSIPIVMRYNIVLEGQTGSWSQASLNSIRDQLISWGVRSPGNMASINQSQTLRGDATMNALSEREIRQGMTIIETLRTMGNRGGAPYSERTVGRGSTRRTVIYHSRIIEAWNNNKDDLGDGRRYPTILHFAVRLEQMARESMHRSYLEAIRIMPTVRLAGLEIGVHPRAVYFIAAAQAEMDVRSGIREGEGHYMPPGAFFIELKRIQRLASSMAQPSNRQRRGARAQSPCQEQACRIGIEAFNRMREEVRTMVAAMEQQQLAGSDQPVEHREPGLQRYLLPLAEQLRALPEATTADEARTLAGRLNRMLGTIPFSQRTHGGGSIDPHGTAHALGLAIDIFNGVSNEGIYQNFGVPAGNWPFLHLLMDRFGESEAMRTLRPRAIHELNPEEAQELALLINRHGQSLADELRSRREQITDRDAARARAATLGGFGRIRNRVLQGYYRRWQSLTIALSRTAWYRNSIEVRRLAEECQRLLTIDRRSFSNLSPQQVRDSLDQVLPRLQALYELGQEVIEQAEATASIQAESEEERRDQELDRGQRGVTTGRGRRERLHRSARQRAISRRQAAQRSRARDFRVLEDVQPSASSSSLNDLRDRLAGTDESYENYQTAFIEEREAQALRVVTARGFAPWLQRVQNIERPMYDQPQIMVESLNAVLSHRASTGGPQTHFYGGHHWEVAPERILTDARAYEEALQRDLSQPRRRAMIDRVLTIMAESSGGQDILRGSDQTFLRILRSLFPDVNTRIQRALARVTNAAGGVSSPLADFLRVRGFHYLAGDETTTTEGEAGNRNND